MPRPPPEPHDAWRPWLHRFGGARSAELADAVQLDEHASMVRAAGSIVDVVVRRVLVLSGTYGEGHEELAALPSLLDQGDRAAAMATLRRLQEVQELRGRSPHTLGSAVLALCFLDELARAATREAMVEAWARLFFPCGALHMVVARHERVGLPRGVVAAAVEATMRSLAATTPS